MEYVYKAVDITGLKKNGVIEANSETEIASYLKKNNLIPISIKKKVNSDISAFLPFQSVKGSDIVIFTRQLSSMILTGLTLIEALNILKKQSNSPALSSVLDSLVADISEGKPFSEALKKHPDVFSDVYISLVKAAEAGGMIDQILGRLADNLEKSEELQKNIKSALFYPVIIVVGMMIVITVMNIAIIPQLNEIYKSMNVELPFITKIVVGMSEFFVKYILFMFLGMIGLVVLFGKFRTSKNGKRIIHKITLKLPVFGNIITLAVLTEISRTLSLLIRSGSSIIDALHTSANVSSNIWYKEAVDDAAGLVEKGFNLSTSFENQSIFPAVLIQMIKVGEETGKIDESLEKVSEYFQRDLTLKIRTLTTAMEPILIAILGVTVGFLILAIITPIYSIITQIQ